MLTAQGQSSNYTGRLMAPCMNYFYLFSPVPTNRCATAFYIVGWDSIWSYVTDFGDHEKLDNSKRLLNVQCPEISSEPSTSWTRGVFGSAHSVGSHGFTVALVWTYSMCTLHCACCHTTQFQQTLSEMPQLASRFLCAPNCHVFTPRTKFYVISQLQKTTT